MSGAVVSCFRFSEVGILSWSFFVLSILDYLLTTDCGQSTKSLQQNVSFRCNFGRMGLISFGIGLLGVIETKFSSFFFFPSSFSCHSIRWRRQTQWKKFSEDAEFQNARKKDYMMCTKSFLPNWSSPTFLTGLWTWPFQTTLPGMCKSLLPDTFKHMSENCLWHRSKCRSNTDPF